MSQQKTETPLEWVSTINKNRTWSRVMMVVAIAMIIGGATSGGYFISKRQAYQRQMNRVAGVSVQSPQEAVRNLMVVPNEEPVIQIVSQQDLNGDSDFYSNAQVGDVLLIYPNAGKTVLYDPETNRIVEVETATRTRN